METFALTLAVLAGVWAYAGYEAARLDPDPKHAQTVGNWTFWVVGNALFLGSVAVGILGLVK